MTGARYATLRYSPKIRTVCPRFQEVKGQLDLVSDTFEQLKPGLSAFPDDPAAAAESLQPLLDTALKTVPASAQVAHAYLSPLKAKYAEQ